MTKQPTDDELNDLDEGLQPKPKPPKYAWIDDHLRPIAEREGGTDWLTKRPARREYLLSYLMDLDGDGAPKGVIAAGRVGFLASPGGVGKSYTLCSLALAVAVADRQQRTCWLGALEVNVDKAGRVLMLMGEEEEEEIRRRLYMTAEAMGLSDDDKRRAIQRIVPVALSGHDGVAFTQAAEVGDTKTETPFSEALRERLEKVGEWSLVIVDPLARFAGDDVEKDNAAATRLVQVLEKLSNLPGKPTVFCAHHTRKAGNDKVAMSSDDMRGASALRDGARFLAVLEEQERIDGAPNLVNFAVKKNNYGIRPAFMLTRNDDGNLRAATEQERKQYADAVKDKEKEKKRRDDSMGVFEAAWWGSSCQKRDGAPYVSRDALERHFKGAGWPDAKIKTTLAGKSGLLAELLEAKQISVHDKGWTVVDTARAAKMVLSEKDGKESIAGDDA